MFQINKFHLKNVNRKDLGIAPHLSYLNLERTNYQQEKFKWTKQNRIGFVNKDVISVAHYSTLDNNDDSRFEVPLINNESNENLDIKIEDQDEDNILNSLDAEENDNNDQYNDNEDVQEEINTDNLNEVCNEENKADGTGNKEEYADLYPMSAKEAKAAFEVFKLFQHGDYKCNICGYSFNTEDKLNVHTRMHNMV